jgi:hypothetical protein
MGIGIWNDVIMDKYLAPTFIIKWYRSQTFNSTSVSMIWRGLLKSIHLITHCLCWHPGSGQQVAIGTDRIMGLEDISFLLPELISSLKHKKYLVSLTGLEY